MNNIVEDSRKYENLKEYLRSKGVLAKLLTNPRSYEFLDLLIDKFNIVTLNDEMLEKLNKELIITPEKGISIMGKKEQICLKGVKCNNNSEILMTKRIVNEKEFINEKRYFDSNGIETVFKVEKTPKTEENQDVLIMPREVTKFERDSDRIDMFIQTQTDKNGFKTKKFFIRRNYIELHNIKLDENVIKRTNIDKEKVYANIYDEKLYEMVKEDYKPEYSKIIKEYKGYNSRYFLPKVYEKSIEKACNKNKVIGGE